MEQKSNWNLVIEWFKKCKGYIVFVGVVMLTYWIIAALRHLDLAAIGYSTLIGSFIGAWLMLFNFLAFRKKYQALLNTYHNKAYSLETLPEAHGLIEASYVTLIKELEDDLTHLRRRVNSQQEEADDYYTLWTHQIKTPIAAMRLVLQSEGSKEDIKQMEERVILEKELFKIEQYAEMALQYLRLESMSQDLVLKEYKLYDIVANALKKYRVYFMGDQLELQIDAFDTKIITDEKWLQFVIEQILSNSVKYTPQGRITIRMQDEETLMIQDTGIGIQEEDIPRIFDRGFTGYNGRMDQKSTGIGLYLCKKVMDKLSHTLEINAQVGQGTTVRLSFPTNKEALTLQE